MACFYISFDGRLSLAGCMLRSCRISYGAVLPSVFIYLLQYSRLQQALLQEDRYIRYGTSPFFQHSSLSSVHGYASIWEKLISCFMVLFIWFLPLHLPFFHYSGIPYERTRSSDKKTRMSFHSCGHLLSCFFLFKVDCKMKLDTEKKKPW